MTDYEKIKVRVQIGITIVVGVFSIYLISVEPESGSKLKWAYGIIGLLIGYWLK
jgi:uncharacterized membrane protein